MEAITPSERFLSPKRDIFALFPFFGVCVSTYACASCSAAQSRGGQDNRLQDFTNPNQRKIMSYLFKLGPVDSLPSDGVPITQIVKGSGVQHDIVVMEVENLVAEGHLYTTSDDEQ